MSGAAGSALYAGIVTHRRLRPRRHRLRYRVFSLLLDLDEIPAVCARLRLLSHRRFNLFGFDERDHADGSGGSLRDWVEGHLADAGIDLDGGPIRLLAMPRVLGYGFNPISVWFCYRRDGRLAALLHEVHNTFGERHSYLIPVAAADEPASIGQSCDKAFHVSPFMAMDMRYDFRVHAPDERLSLIVRGCDDGGPAIVAALAATRVELTDAALLRAFCRTPLLTLKVIGGIHWEALRLWIKGVRLHRRPAAPAHAVSIAMAAHSGTIWELADPARPEVARATCAGPIGAGPIGASPTGASPTGASPTGAGPTGARANGPGPTGARAISTGPTGTRPTGARPTDAHPTGAHPTGAGPTIANPSGTCDWRIEDSDRSMKEDE
jgi:DUF1365 family protein